MAGFHTRMIRSAYAWRPTRASIHDLSQHLFARFEVPQFAHRAWFDEVTEIRVLLDMARGINPRKAVTNSGLAARLTRKASHLFANAPDRFGVLDTIRWAQLRSLGASIDAANRIVKACQGYRYDEAFWLDLARDCSFMPATLSRTAESEVLSFRMIASSKRSLDLSGSSVTWMPLVCSAIGSIMTCPYSPTFPLPVARSNRYVATWRTGVGKSTFLSALLSFLPCVTESGIRRGSNRWSSNLSMRRGKWWNCWSQKN